MSLIEGHPIRVWWLPEPQNPFIWENRRLEWLLWIPIVIPIVMGFATCWKFKKHGCPKKKGDPPAVFAAAAAVVSRGLGLNPSVGEVIEELGYSKEDIMAQAQAQMDQRSSIVPKPQLAGDIVEHVMGLKVSDFIAHSGDAEVDTGGLVKRAIDGTAKVSGWHWGAGQILAVVTIVVVIVSVSAFITWRIKLRRKIRFAKTDAVVENGTSTDAGEETPVKREKVHDLNEIKE
ncbi:MAG: hypothetical protein Q9222_004499 [Ikaeria aurantiellina]